MKHTSIMLKICIKNPFKNKKILVFKKLKVILRILDWVLDLSIPKIRVNDFKVFGVELE